MLAYLPRIDPTHMTEVLTRQASGWWLDGMDYIWLDNTPDQDYNAEMDYFQFSPWEELDDEETNWLLTYGEDVMFYQSMMMLGGTTRQNSGTYQKYKLLRDESLKTLLNTDYDLQEGGQKYEVMEFVPTYYGSDLWPS